MSTTTDEQQTDAGTAESTDQTAEAETTTGTEDAETFPREYVERLRQENADQRVKAKRGDALAQRLVLAYAQALGKLADPTDLPFDVALCDADGIPDPAKVSEAVDELIGRKPHLADRRPRGDVGQGATGDSSAVDLAGLLRSRAG